LDDCQKNLKRLQSARKNRWEGFDQICHRRECCTTTPNKGNVPDDVTQQSTGLDYSFVRKSDLKHSSAGSLESESTEPDAHLDCQSLGGYHLASPTCVTNKNCNEIKGLDLGHQEQIECLNNHCCISPRKLTSEKEVICTGGGQFMGKFCKHDGDCGQVEEVCERHRYCCGHTKRYDPLGMEFDDPDAVVEGCNRPEDQLTTLICYNDNECAIVRNGYCSLRG
jgi:hypothetical protein